MNKLAFLAKRALLILDPPVRESENYLLIEMATGMPTAPLDFFNNPDEGGNRSCSSN